MKRQKNKWISILSLVLGFSLFLTGCSIGSRQVYFASKTGSRDVFKIGDLSCRQEEAKVYLANYKNLYGKVYGTDLWTEEYDTEGMEASVKDAVLSHLTKVYALNVYAQEKEISLTETEMEATENAAKTYYDAMNRQERKYTKASEKEIREMYRRYALAEKVYVQLMENVDDNVSEDEARVMDAYMLYVTDEKLAKKINTKLKNGATFERLASTYNESESTRVTFGRNTYDKAIEDVVFRLENEEVSQMIETKDGYYFFLCVNKYNEKLSEENKENIVQQRQKQAMDDVITQVEKANYSHLNQKRWDKIQPPTSAEVTTNTFFTTLDSYISY